MKKLALIILIILGLTILSGGYLWFGNVYRLNNKFITGSVKKIDSDSWGITTTFPRHKLSVRDLPTEFQKEGSKVKCKVVISDVIGMNDWDVYAEISDCKIK